MKELTFAVIGCGNRGIVFGNYLQRRPHHGRVVAIAEPHAGRREAYRSRYGVEASHSCATWEELLARPKLADAVIITTSDRDHFGPAMKAMELGYHVLLEKPMSNDPVECLQLARKAEESGVVLKVCHSQRYAPFYLALHDLVRSGRIGRLVSIDWAEDVSYWHYAHSFVRGNWRNVAEGSPMILAKCCHDMDSIQALVGKRCLRLSSFGSLSFYKPENAPPGATKRCTDGCPHEPTCEYSALKFYLRPEITNFIQMISVDTSLEARLKALREGRYGKCVFYSDNDVVDHQSVAMEFEDGVTVSFTMSAFTAKGTRKFHLRGTAGEIRGDSDAGSLELRDFHGRTEQISVAFDGEHGGGDDGIMRSFVAQLTGASDQNPTSARASARSHLLAFAAEEARVTGQVVDLLAYEERLGAMIPGTPSRKR